MAKQDKIFLKGKIANLIFYEWRGKPCSRTMPDEVKQTTATKASAKDFGKAATYSKHLRNSLHDFLPYPKDKPMMYALNNELRKWLSAGAGDRTKMIKAIARLEEFQFNEPSPLTGRLKVKPTVDWTKKNKVIVHLPSVLPSERVSAPAYTRTVHCTVKVVSCRINNSDPKMTAAERTFDFPYNNVQQPAQNIELPFTLSKGHLVLVAMKLEYTAKGKRVNDQRWLPAGVIGAWFS
jgi:hypothetical protein